MKNRYFAFGLICFLTFGAHFSLAQTNRGVGNIKVKTGNGKTKEIKLYENSYALVIGESNYTNGWDKLPGVKTDVAEVRSALERQGFRVETEINLIAEAFKPRIDLFIQEYGYQENNRLLIYFAGHGHTQKSADGRDLGYIIPVDAPLPEKDDIGFRRKAISMDTIQAYARRIEAKHALFVFDSCFSGKLISRDKITIPPVIQENVAYPVRQFITAGAANQSVPDDSVFRKAFVRGIDGEADRNKDGYITGSELADYLKEKVTNSTERAQTPQYGKIRDIDLDRGDFVFAVPEKTAQRKDNEEDFSGGNGPGYGGIGNGDSVANTREKKPPSQKCEGETTPLKITFKPVLYITDEFLANAENGVEYTVRLRVTFTANGLVSSVSVITALKYGTTERAIAAAKGIKFIPAKECGIPKTVTETVEFSFRK